jgi:DNA-binding response OmpR family regulator
MDNQLMRKLIGIPEVKMGTDATPILPGMGAAADSRPQDSRQQSTAPSPTERVGADTRTRALATVLLIEDEPGIVDFVCRGLEAEGFAVAAATDGLQGERLALGGGFDAIVLDLMLPRRGGLEVLASVRRALPSVPVIVLSARGEIGDRVEGLDAGAVDYLVKPFSMAELVARVRAQLRVVAQVSVSTLRAEDIEVDLLTRRVRRAGQTLTLSTTEFELLVHLLRHPGQVVSREQILSSVWGYDHDPATNLVDVYVGYLRRKLRCSGKPAPIFTVRAVGYRLGSSS